MVQTYGDSSGVADAASTQEQSLIFDVRRANCHHIPRREMNHAGNRPFYFTPSVKVSHYASSHDLSRRSVPCDFSRRLVGFHTTCALFHSTCARVPPILRQPYNTASARVARCGTTRGLAQDRWNFLQDRRTSRGTRAQVEWNSALHKPCIGAFRVESYNSQATWQRLAPFFRLPGRVTWGSDTVDVELCPFNDRPLNRDLVAVCARVQDAQPRLPDGRRLVFTLPGQQRPVLHAQQRCVA